MAVSLEDAMKSVVSPSDWAVFLGAATVGLVVDGAWNIISAPFFTPPICASAAASTAMTFKKGFEARADHRRKTREIQKLQERFEVLVALLEEHIDERALENSRLEFDLAIPNQGEMKSIILTLSKTLSEIEQSSEE